MQALRNPCTRTGGALRAHGALQRPIGRVVPAARSSSSSSPARLLQRLAALSSNQPAARQPCLPAR